MENLTLISANLLRGGAGISNVLMMSKRETLRETHSFPMPKFDLHYDAERNDIKIDLGLDHVASAPSLIQEVRDGLHRTGDEMRTFIHDFTFSYLADETDVKLMSVFPTLRDGFDNMTPDAIFENENMMSIYEFATTRNPENTERDYEIKKGKYLEPLQTRVSALARRRGDERYYFYNPIVVSCNRITTSVQLNMNFQLVNELCARFRFAQACVDEAIRQGLRLMETPSAQELVGIEAMINSIKVKLDPEGTIRGITNRVVNSDDVSERDAITYSTLAYNQSLMEGVRQQGVKSEDVALEKEIAMNEYKSSIIGSRRDDKAVIQLPGVFPMKEIVPEEIGYGSGSETMIKVWNEVIFKIKEGELDFVERSLTEEMEIADMDGDDPRLNNIKEARKEYRRVQLDLDIEIQRDLAKLGVEGKKWKDDGEVRAHMIQKKEGFSLDCDVSDINTFLDDPKPIRQGLVSGSTGQAFSLIESAVELHGNPDKTSCNFSRSWLRTSEAQWADMISAIGTELSISLKQHVKKKNFIVKKLKNHHMLLLIKSTNSSEHIFVSFLWLKDFITVIPEGVSKRYYDAQAYYCTDFVSFSNSKLVNIVKTGPFSLVMAAEWMRFYDFSMQIITNQLTATNLLAHHGFRKMFWISMLIHLEDKHQTEEIMTTLRYIAMEKFSTMPPREHKMTEKLPTVLRSRLQVWATQIMLQEMLRPKYLFEKARKARYDEVVDPEEDLTVDADDLKSEYVKGHWIGIINPYTNEPIDEPRKLIELFYLGYAKNKDETPNPNTEFELVRKIIKYEDLLRESRPQYFGEEDIPIKINEDAPTALSLPELEERGSIQRVPRSDMGVQETRFHEWSRSSVLACADSLKNHLRSIMGVNYQDTLDKQIMTRWQNITWERIATLKASSVYDPSTGKDISHGKVVSSRTKVITAVLNMPEYVEKKPWEIFPLALDWVDKDGGLRVDIFKKNQHGGLREIYVLELRSRLIQLFIEELSRAICSNIPSEVMMHPENKINRPQEHIVNAAKAKESYKASINSSNDAKVWNQGHHVNKFIQFLARLLPDKYHGLIVKVLRQWKTKRIALPNGVLNLLRTSPETQFYNEMDQKLAHGYIGFVNVAWIKPGSHHLTVETGMMQGILHYTSSLFHAAMLMHRDLLFRAVCRAKSIQSTTTDLVSSDDSARLTDVSAKSKASLRESILWARADHLAIGTFSRLFGIYMSTKSTMCTDSVLEFNSEFFFRASLARPTIKWAYASLNLSEVESIFERQEVLYNLSSQLLEGGAGFLQTAVTQVAQGLLHYKMLGSDVNPLWSLHCLAINENRDPSLGFFLMDNPRAAGLFGLTYNFWRTVVSCEDLQSRLKQQLLEGDLTTTTAGSLTSGVQVRFGSRAKVRRLIAESSERLPDWRDQINANPTVLYKFPRSFEERVIRLMVKLTSPSVSTALSKGNEITRLIAAGVYLINRQANTIGSGWMTTLGLMKERNEGRAKVSLWKLAKALPPRSRLTNEEMEVLFPMKTQYEYISATIRDINSLKMTIGGSRKSLRSHISVFSQFMSVPFSLEQMVRYRWMNEVLAASVSYLDRMWDYYRRLIPWLRDTPEMTLEQSPFTDHIQLRNFIARLGQKPRTIHLTGSPIKSTDTRDMLVVALIRNQFPSIVLMNPAQASLRPRSSVLERIQHGTSITCMYPYKPYYVESTVKAILASHPQVWAGESRRFGTRATKLAVMQAFAKLPGQELSWRSRDNVLMDKQEFINILTSSGKGVIGAFTREQHRRGAEWVGKGTWAGSVGKASINFDMQDDRITRIVCDNVAKLREESGLMKGLLRDMNLKTLTTASLSGAKYYLINGDVTNDPQGTPIFENANYRYNFDIDPDQMFLQFKSGVLYLKQRTRRQDVVILDYKPATSDIRFNIAMDIPGDSLFTAWVKNMPLQAGALERFLFKVSESKVKKESKYDNDSLIDFFRVILLSSLIKGGWRVKEKEMLVLMGDKEDYELDEETLALMESLDFVGFGTEEEMSQIPAFKVSDIGMATDIDDVIESSALLSMQELLDFKYIESKIKLGDIRKEHRLMSSLLNEWYQLIGLRGRQLLMSKKFDQATEKISKVFSWALGWDMTEFSGDLTLPGDMLEDILEEID
uniref:RNA-directed RNA polymerase L n=1 Tax=Hodotermopsis sjostedti phenuivirus 3 TaxID=3133461 RepID=A0AAT9J9P7_9VIRU